MNTNKIDNQIYQHEQQALQVQQEFLKFLSNFEVKYEGDDDPENLQIGKIYVKRASKMLEQKKTTLQINYNDIFTYYNQLAEIILHNYLKLEQYLRKSLYQFIHDLLIQQNKPEKTDERTIFFLSISNIPAQYKLRELKTNNIGKLVSFNGTITRSTEVRPELLAGTFRCLVCNKEIRDVEQQFKYTTPLVCKETNCQNRNEWELIINQSTFSDFQKLRVQENSSEIPSGSMPRSIDVILRDNICDTAKPGDKCVFSGCLIVVPDITSLSKPGERLALNQKIEGQKTNNWSQMEGITGLKALGVRDLNYKLVFIANYVGPIQNRFNQIPKQLSAYDNTGSEEEIQQHYTVEDLQAIQQMREDKDIYLNLAKSIAPSICGHEEIKKGILLMLMGGVNKKTHDGINLRGDINICIVGDPSTAKSQFLKYVTTFLPRSVYTSGKASTSAGLTASVTRDNETGEFCIEVGALMLADQGVCCIDEFDKMDKKDQVSIHEAMEQQTISITKAGIQATLNARASILAAANPIFGRYDKSKSLKNNLDMSAPIMSRFDLFYVIVDECDTYVDEIIAKYIVNIHKDMEQALQNKMYKLEEIQKYIKFARQIKPELTQEAAIQLQQCYIQLRANDVSSQNQSYRITVRQLESLIRLSEALARVYLEQQITSAMVKEAARLLSSSILKIEKQDLEVATEPLESLAAQQQNVQGTTQNIVLQQIQQIEQQQQEKQKKITLAHEEYYKYSKKIIGYVQQQIKIQEFQLNQQQENKQEMIIEKPRNGIQTKDIIEWFLEDNLDQIQSEEDAKKYKIIAKAVIKRLIDIEKILIVTQDNPQDKLLQYVTLHSNYTEDI